MMELTEQQQKILDYIKENKTATYEDIQKHFGYKNRASVAQKAHTLFRKGYLHSPYKSSVWLVK